MLYEVITLFRERVVGRSSKQEFVIEQGHGFDAGRIPGQGDQGGVQRARAQLVDQAPGLA